MSYLFFENVLEQLGRKLQYDAIVNYAGNSFAKDSWDMITKANPMMNDKTNNKAVQGVANLFDSANIKVMKAGEKKEWETW